MKITLKTKAESTDQYTMRLPASLVQHLNSLRARAADLGVDFSATQADVMGDFVEELETRMTEMEQSNASAHTRIRTTANMSTHTSTTNSLVRTPSDNGSES